jgi:hypothetical protein
MTSQMARDTVRYVADVLPRAGRRADWRAVRALFDQLVQLARNDLRRIPDEVSDAFADAVAGTHLSYAGDEEQFCQDALAILADVEGRVTVDAGLFRDYYQDDRFGRASGPARDLRRRPGPFEALVETCRRMRDARSLRAACHGTGSSGMLIGSTSYGAFFNVRGHRGESTASDLDFVIVVRTPEALDSIAAALALLPGTVAADIDRFRQRSRVFAGDLVHDGTVFSHKIRLWADGRRDPLLAQSVVPAHYLLSMHVMTGRVLDYVLVSSTPRLRRESAGARRTLLDYREAATGCWDDLYDFAGRLHRTQLDTKAVTGGGSLRSPKVYHIDELDCYFPGFYQTMFFPKPDLLWDDLDVQPAVDVFQRKLIERIGYESERRGHTKLRPSFAHVRRDVLAPRVARHLDDGYSRP